MTRREGFTLVELLVAMGLLGIVLAGIFGLVTSTLRFSAASQSASDRLRELTNATGYVVDQIRGANSAVTCGDRCVRIEVTNVNGITLTGSSQVVELAIVPREGLDPAWLEPNGGGAFALVERRHDGTYLVLDLLTNASRIDVDGATVTVAFQVSRAGRGGETSTPRDEPYTIVVTPRNAS